MNLAPNTILQDQRGEQRWKILRHFFTHPQYQMWEVADQWLPRSLLLMTLNYQNLPEQNTAFAIRELRASFDRMAEALCGNYTFLPEPVDLIEFTNTQDELAYDLRSQERGLILAQAEGRKLYPLKKEDEYKLSNLKKTVIACLKTFKGLHADKKILQELPLSKIVLNPTTFQPYFLGVHALTFLAEFIGYNPNKLCLRPNPMFSAPECFDPQGSLSPATDIYALGKLILQMLMTTQEYQQWIPGNDPFPLDLQNRVHALDLPEKWERFVVMCLQPDPSQRFQNATEAEIFLMSDEKKQEIRSSQQAKASSHKQASSPNHSQRASWQYRENQQLPPAALVVWSDGLTTRDEQFNFQELYRRFQYQYTLTPRFFFQKNNYNNKNTVQGNPFFTMLQDSYKLQVVLFPNQEDGSKSLIHELDPHWNNLQTLVLVGNSGEYAVQTLLQHPNAGKWNIHWICKGSWRPSFPIKEVIDIAPFLRKKQEKP
ncbi:hypothetical protein WDW89_16935 [Deltaproteobacteria bacterium TL4]